ncbi:hypothetical protein FACS189494_04950 [Spirochaetia bacterium]|nr:hypothetical protein FACS189494_04950 [Spirochaetia bacterium]
MMESADLRKILSKNIRAAREKLCISQSRLAEYANISVPYMTDIEYCKTWVSDKTLISIARALNMEVYELLRPFSEELNADYDKQGTKKETNLHQIAKLICDKKKTLKKSVNESLDDLILQIIKLHSSG